MNSNVGQDWLDCLKRWSYVALGDRQVIQFGGELEVTLRDFVTDLDSYAEVLSPRKCRKTSSLNRDPIYSKSGSNLQPADSTYASISASAESLSTPSNISILTLSKTSKDIIKDKEQKSLIICRLEQLFIGRSKGADILETPPMRPGADLLSIYEATTSGSKPIQEVRILYLDYDPGAASDYNKDNMGTKCNNSGLASDSKLSSLALSQLK
ncbi:hypothetical protein DER44DRAFT_815602 [Fusarium oxysporum]|nr:hypothetical protein DER44DRAFT_815602 [Fusarium oxysporum]